MRQKWAEIVQERNDYIIKRWQAGDSAHAIANEVGVTITTVRLIAKKAKCELRPRIRLQLFGPTEKQVEWQKRRCEMIAMRESGKTLQEVAKAFGVSRQRVQQAIGPMMFEHVCPVCDDKFTNGRAADSHCSPSCCQRESAFGLKKARALTAVHRERKANKAAGLRRCYGPCKQWLPRADFSPGKVSMCKKCAIARQQKYYYQRKANNAT